MKKTIRAARRLACALGIVCAGFAGVSAAQQKVQMGVPTIGDYIAVYVAYDEGIFAKHGLDVTLHPMGISSLTTAGLLSRSLDVAALSRIAVAVGQVIAGAGGAIASLDLNPVMVGAAGQGAVVVDALVEVSKA